MPLQVAAEVEVPLAQVAAAHTVPAWYLRHAPMPLHVPSFPQVAAPSSLQVLAGSGPPVGTGWHMPALPARLQEKQLAVHAVPQQTPCAQKLDTHSSACAHSEPFGFLPHELFWQSFGDTQSAAVEHEFAHAAPLHL
jgi:hypothetical protein